MANNATASTGRVNINRNMTDSQLKDALSSLASAASAVSGEASEFQIPYLEFIILFCQRT